MDAKGIDLNLLVSLDVLLEERNVTRAAARLKLSQPALSSQLNRLRRLFGDPLLVPADSGRGMMPTMRGRALAGPLHAALQELALVVEHKPSFDPLRDARDFHIATTDSGIVVIGLALLARLDGTAGAGIRIAFHLLDPAGVAAKIDRRDIDLVIAPPGHVPAPLKSRHLYDESFCMTQRKGHPRGPGPLDLDTYCALDHVLVSLDGGGFEGRVDQELARIGRTRRVALSLPTFTVVPPVLRTTDFVCTMPTRFVRTLGEGFETAKLPLTVPGHAVCMAWHARHQQDPAHQWLRRQIVEIAATTGQPAARAAGQAASLPPAT